MLKEDIRKMWNLQEQNTSKINLYRCTECSELQTVHVEYVNFSILILWNDYIESHCCSSEDIGIIVDAVLSILLKPEKNVNLHRSYLRVKVPCFLIIDIFNSDSDFWIPCCFLSFFSLFNLYGSTPIYHCFIYNHHLYPMKYIWIFNQHKITFSNIFTLSYYK